MSTQLPLEAFIDGLTSLSSYRLSTKHGRLLNKNTHDWKCLRSHHTNDFKSNSTTCDKCKKNHHPSLQHDKKGMRNLNEEPKADRSKSQKDEPVNNNADMNLPKHKCIVKAVTGLLSIQKVKIGNSSGELVQILAMLDTGPNTSLLSKTTPKRLGLTIEP